MSLHSCIYEGHVRHRRFAPVANQFRYRVFLMYLDLAELPRLFDGPLAVVRQPGERGLFPPAGPLGRPSRAAGPGGAGFGGGKDWVIGPRVPSACSLTCAISGTASIPVSFYYCFDPGREQRGDHRRRGPQHALGRGALLRAGRSDEPASRRADGSSTASTRPSTCLRSWRWTSGMTGAFGSRVRP